MFDFLHLFSCFWFNLWLVCLFVFNRGASRSHQPPASTPPPPPASSQKTSPTCSPVNTQAPATESKQPNTDSAPTPIHTPPSSTPPPPPSKEATALSFEIPPPPAIEQATTQPPAHQPPANPPPHAPATQEPVVKLTQNNVVQNTCQPDKPTPTPEAQQTTATPSDPHPFTSHSSEDHSTTQHPRRVMFLGRSRESLLLKTPPVLTDSDQPQPQSTSPSSPKPEDTESRHKSRLSTEITNSPIPNEEDSPRKRSKPLIDNDFRLSAPPGMINVVFSGGHRLLLFVTFFVYFQKNCSF